MSWEGERVKIEWKSGVGEGESGDRYGDGRGGEIGDGQEEWGGRGREWR